MSGGPDVIVVGAGLYGLSAAWHLARRGAKVWVFDGGDFASGGSGRNLAGFRMQWGLEFNISLSQESIEFFEDVEERLGYPGGIECKQGGYLLLAHDEATLDGFRQVRPVHEKFGVPSEILAPGDIARMVPGLNMEGVLGGSFCGKDGTANPFLLLDAFLKAARREGVSVQFGTPVLGIERHGDGFLARVPGGGHRAPIVLVCTDWQAPELLAPLGVEVPITGLSKEAIATERRPPMIGPLLISYKHDLVINQMGNGTILAYATRDRPQGGDFSSTPGYLPFAARKVVDLMPPLSKLRVLRTWAGVVSCTPDMQAVLGETGIPGLYIAVSAYKGFMTCPAVGRLMAELILDGESDHPAAARLTLERFRTGDLVPEPLTV